ncbi:hypothetical protein EDD22DRAFT_852440 [Suillus occidentalis]|nr:hypothetical protein EDD22DRAFT_852440 [Suillus occidentalis]
MTINIDDVSLLLKCLSILMSELVVDMGDDSKSHSTTSGPEGKCVMETGYTNWYHAHLVHLAYTYGQSLKSRFERDISITKGLPTLAQYISDPEQTMHSRISNDKVLEGVISEEDNVIDGIIEVII